VNCDRQATVLHAYFDDELDPVDVLEFENHLQQCAECSQALERLKSLRSEFRDPEFYHHCPERLREALLREKTPSPGVRTATHRFWIALAVAAGLLLMAMGAWQVFSARSRAMQDSLLASEVVDAHLRSLQPGHLIDVLSSDQHTVKPWFDGKLDFAPPVRDFSAQGFPLQGGRLDVVHGRTVAALVYGRRKHLVSVFVWPAVDADMQPQSGSQQGYQWISWHKAGMVFFAVSDTAASDLAQLQQLLAQ